MLWEQGGDCEDASDPLHHIGHDANAGLTKSNLT